MPSRVFLGWVATGQEDTAAPRTRTTPPTEPPPTLHFRPYSDPLGREKPTPFPPFLVRSWPTPALQAIELSSVRFLTQSSPPGWPCFNSAKEESAERESRSGREQHSASQRG